VAISAREKSSQWQLALQCSISACEKDSQWQLALSLLSLMQGAKVLPEGIKRSAAISAREKDGQ
jgi:hypothetical protein